MPFAAIYRQRKSEIQNFLMYCLDAYARIAFCKQSDVTGVLTQTLCPTWDQTLIFEDVEINEDVENVVRNPPSVVVELFDRDSVVSESVQCSSLSILGAVFSDPA